MNKFIVSFLIVCCDAGITHWRAAAGSRTDVGTHTFYPTHFTKRRKVSKDNYSQSIGNGK